MSYSPVDIDYCSECEHVVEGEVGWHGLCPYCGSEVRPAPDDMVIMITNAPKAYDYGYTYELSDDIGYRVKGGMDCDKPIRMIAIDDDYHAQIQKDRNFSGLHPTLTSEEFTQWVHDGLLVEAPEPVPCVHCGAPILDGKGHDEGCSYE